MNAIYVKRTLYVCMYKEIKKKKSSNVTDEEFP